MGKNYIDNARFEELIFLYQKEPLEYEDELFGLFDLLISNIFDSFGFTVDRDDAKQECFLLIIKTLPGFESSKGSAFNYFTTVILNNLKLIYTKNKKYLEKLDMYADILKKKANLSDLKHNK